MHDAIIGRVVLGRYRVIRALAKGGMGVVYLGRSEGASGFTKPVVIKRMASDLMMDKAMARMFVREARLMSRLRHPALVGVIDFGEEEGDYLMVIEYVHGYHLGQWHRFRKKAYGPFPVDLIIHIILKVLDALHYAHNLKGDDGQPLKIVHRDVSPANILIDVDGLVKLADFGIARSTDQTEQTEASTIKGKMPYLAPELFHLEDPSPSSDAYACGVVLQELLVGRNEFRAKDVATTVSRVLQHTPTPIESLRDDLPEGFGPVLRKALAKSVGERYKTAAEFAAALRAVSPTTEDAMQTRLLELAQQDFRDPRISDLVNAASLRDREEAWRNPPGVEPAADKELQITLRPKGAQKPASSSPSSSPTTIAKVTADVATQIAPAVIAPRRSPIPWIVGGVIALAAIAATVIVVVRQGPAMQAQPPTFIQVQSGQAQDSGRAAMGADDGGRESHDGSAEESTDTAVAVPAADTSPTAMARTGMMRRPSGPDATILARAFHARRSDVTACYRDHSEHAPSSGHAELAISVNADGSVAGARVTPPSVASTPLGACVVGIARSTNFPGQGEPVRFRIPLRFTAQ